MKPREGYRECREEQKHLHQGCERKYVIEDRAGELAEKKFSLQRLLDRRADYRNELWIKVINKRRTRKTDTSLQGGHQDFGGHTP